MLLKVQGSRPSTRYFTSSLGLGQTMHGLIKERLKWELNQKRYVNGISAYSIIINGFEIYNVEQMFAFNLPSTIEELNSLIEFLLRLDYDFPEHELLIGLFVTNEQLIFLVFRYNCVVLFILGVWIGLLLAHFEYIEENLIREAR